MRRPLAILSAGLLLFASGLVLASCSGDEEAVSTTEATITSETTTTETEQESTTTQTFDPGPRVVTVVVENGVPKGGIARKTVTTGDRVVLIVRSDVSDHVHLHGYDLIRDVAPGKPTRLPFRAAIPGRFEAELEDRGVQIAEITVQS